MPRLPNLGQMPPRLLIAWMVGGAAALALLAGAWMWSQTPDYRTLYTNVSDRDGAAIVAALQQMNVPYKLAEHGGAILVPATHVHEVRLRLAGQGLPRGSAVGFELMENARLGTSQFLEQVNYQRALEGELARSVQSLASVAAARVHLALSRSTSFVRETQKPSASVLVNLHPGRTLEPSQVSAITHLVSSSVPGLPPQNVTVVDQAGRLLSSPGGADDLEPGQLKYVQELEQSYAQRIEAILAPVVGAANVRAQVTADVDFSRVERAEETYRPNQGANSEPAVRTQHLVESTDGGGSIAAGIPGALSNQPPGPSSAPIDGKAAPQAAAAGVASGSRRKESSVAYELDRTIRHVRQPVGTLRRVSAAVVINYRKEALPGGKSEMKPLPEAQMAQITSLVKEAIGFSEARGDTVNVANTRFVEPEQETLPPVPLWRQPETLVLAKEIGKHLLIAGVILFLFLSVLRPLLKRLSQPLAPALAAPADAQGAALAAPRPATSFEENLDMARQLARQEPKLVANVVKNWVSGDE